MPTDFSETSKNAGAYVFGIAQKIGAKKIAIYHHYQPQLVYKPNGELDEERTIQPARQQSMLELDEFRDSLGDIPEGIEVHTYQGGATVNEGILEVAGITQADLIVMGYKQGNFVKDTFIGSHCFSLARKTTTPILVVPHDATFSGIGKIGLIDDLDIAEHHIPFDKVKKFLHEAHAELDIVHVLKASENEETNDAKEVLAPLFSEFPVSVHYVGSDKGVDGVLDYLEANKLDLAITVPKFHTFFEKLFQDNTKTLASEGHTPLLLVHK